MEIVIALLLIVAVPAGLAHLLCRRARRRGSTPSWGQALLAAFLPAGAFALFGAAFSEDHPHGLGPGMFVLLGLPMLIPAAIIVACHQSGRLLAGMTWLKAGGLAAAAIVFFYLLAAFVIFNFNSVAVPHDEENFDGKKVAIGPKPWWWVAKAAHDSGVPGGYDVNDWPFVIWKPVCVIYVKSKGFALPSAWR